jgi:hyperosmotically inducible protein
MSNMNYTKLISGLGLAVLMAGSTGCETSKHHDERSEGRIQDDKNITSSIKRELKEEPVYKFEEVTVNTYAGAVQLSGFVNSEGQKRRAQDIAQHTPGVQQVINGLAMKPFVPAPTGTPATQIYAQPPTKSEPPPVKLSSPKDDAESK